MASKRSAFDYRREYFIGHPLLGLIKWEPRVDEMLKLPSTAKGTMLRALCEKDADKRNMTVEEIVEAVHLAARLDHLIAIGGEAARTTLLSDECILSAEQIARLCRRMPPFIREKLKELGAGPVGIDSNPTGAFDTNGWSELRTRLPKFRSTLQLYAQQCEAKSAAPMLESEARAKLLNICAGIGEQCDKLLNTLTRFTPNGKGMQRKRGPQRNRTVYWSLAVTKLSQVLGVLKKTNRDLHSPHWKREWVPTTADHEIVISDVKTMLRAAQTLSARA